MSRSNSILALLALSTALAACNSGAAQYGARPNRSLDSLNQPVVQRSDYVIDLNAGADGLAAGEADRLDAWFASLGVGYGDRVVVDEPSGPTEGREDVARVAADYGLLLTDGAPVLAGQVSPGSVRVILSRSTASVPNCPNHHKGAWPEGPSATSTNYGCSVNSNIAAMVADPSDLVLGQAGSGTGDAATAAKAIKVYRDTAPSGSKGLTVTTTQSGGN